MEYLPKFKCINVNFTHKNYKYNSRHGSDNDYDFASTRAKHTDWYSRNNSEPCKENMIIIIDKEELHDSTFFTILNALINMYSVPIKKQIILDLLSYEDNKFDKFLIEALEFKGIIYDKKNGLSLNITKDKYKTILHFVIFYNLNLDELLLTLLLCYYIKDISNVFIDSIYSMNNIYYYINRTHGYTSASVPHVSQGPGNILADRIINANYNLLNIKIDTEHDYINLFDLYILN